MITSNFFTTPASNHMEMKQLPEKMARMTPQRRVILEALRKSGNHPSADRVYELVREKLPHVSMGTVYRNLETLAEAGMIQRLELGPGPRHYDAGIKEHYHIRCLQCGNIEDTLVELPSGLDRAARIKTGFQVVGHELEFVGYCPGCAKNIGKIKIK